MNTFVLFWNPAISSYILDRFHDDLDNGYDVGNWSVWQHDLAHCRDRFFMVRCGEGNTGVCMSGYFISEPYSGEDWSDRGREVYYMDLVFDHVIDPDVFPVLTTAELQKAIPSFDWSGGHSGRLLPDADAETLEKLWRKYLKANETVFHTHATRGFISEHDLDSLIEENKIQADSKDGVIEAKVYITNDGEFRIIYDYNGSYANSSYTNCDLEKAMEEFEKNRRYKSVHYNYLDAHDEELFEKAALLAVRSHRGQVDKAGKPYICHPLRVANKVLYPFDKDRDDAVIVALLHDVIEDTPVTYEMLLEQGFPKHIADAVLALSRREDESYDDFIRRVAENKLAAKVKKADIEDNINPLRLNEFTQEDAARTAKYLKAWKYLTECATKATEK